MVVCIASGGFAIINPDSTLHINAIEAVPLEDIDVDVSIRWSGFNVVKLDKVYS